MNLALIGFLRILGIQYILGNRWFSIGMLSIPNLILKSFIFFYQLYHLQMSHQHCCNLCCNNRGLKSFTNKINITSCIIYQNNYKILMYIIEGIVYIWQSLCVFVYNIFVKWLIISSILILTLLVHSKKIDLSTPFL